jgi:RNase adaptor protein for sRNA GlmZ degradation
MLTINLFSFSYLKSGIPDDDSGNGGGFVFDCRYLYNPGKFPEFSDKTGLDKEVIELLDAKQDMQSFLNNIKNIIRPAIEKYIERDFTNLYVAFGCTGGQHRSVYSAEKLLDFIEDNYPKVRVILTHRELR